MLPAANLIPQLTMNAPTTTVGVLVLLFVLMAFGWLTPSWYRKRVEAIEQYVRETNRIQSETILEQEKTIHLNAKSISKFEDLGNTVEKFIQAAQEHQQGSQ